MRMCNTTICDSCKNEFKIGCYLEIILCYKVPLTVEHMRWVNGSTSYVYLRGYYIDLLPKLMLRIL